MAMHSAKQGDVLAGRYRLTSVIGRGGMGVVWRAADELLRRDVAVKEIIWPAQLEVMEREAVRQRTHREARAAARLTHPNIVSVFDVLEDDGRPWIVMQLLPFPSLGDVIRENGPLSPGQAAHVGLSILAAIKAAHAAGILHRDVKPGNVMLGPDDRIVLTDFGLAVADGSSSLTNSGLLIGSPAYMAPERARGQAATSASDLWSLGATLYAAVEGREPFRRSGALAVLTAVVADDPDKPERAGSLWPAIHGLLRKDPRQRLTASQAEDLLRSVADAETAALPASMTVPLRRRDQRAARAESGAAPLSPARPAAASGAALSPDERTDELQWIAPGARTTPAERGPEVAADGIKPSRPAIATRHPLQQAFARQFGRTTQTLPAPRRNDKRAWVVGLLACAILAAAGTGGYLLTSAGNSGHGSAAPPPSRVRTGHSPGSGSSARDGSSGVGPAGSSPRRGGASAGPVPARTSGTTPSRRSGGSPALPAGYTWYRDPSGFSIGVPAGWRITHQGHLVYIADTGTENFLLIDQTRHPQPNALTDWREQEAARINTYPGYKRILLKAVRYAQAEQAADWEFTYERSGQLTRVLNRNVLVDSHQAYALYWSTPASAWTASFHYFQAFAASFRPLR